MEVGGVGEFCVIGFDLFVVVCVDDEIVVFGDGLYWCFEQCQYGDVVGNVMVQYFGVLFDIGVVGLFDGVEGELIGGECVKF